MEVSNKVLKKIIKECCRSLSYNDEERQFSFPLHSYLDSIWESLKDEICKDCSDFYLNDFNYLLTKLEDLPNQFIRHQCNILEDSSLLNGEIIELTFFDNREDFRLIRMKSGQYLNCVSGVGLSFGKDLVFKVGAAVKTSEGKLLGIIKAISLLAPSNEHIALSNVFIGNYYKKPIGESLWALYNQVVDEGVPSSNTQFDKYLILSKDLGIQSLSLLSILNAAISQWR